MAETVLYFDCFSGISGDMTIGALVDLGVPAAFLLEELGKLPLRSEFDLSFERGEKRGIAGTRARVRTGASRGAAPHHHHGQDHHGHHHHDHAHDDHGHHHPHSHPHTHDHAHARDHDHAHGPHRHLAEIEALIAGARLPAGAEARAHAIFRVLAEAEAKVHGTTLDKVHFHEVGAVDSIVDIVAAALCLDFLGIDRVQCGPVELGGGMVRCEHGLMPVPAPATAELLRDVPCTYGRVASETTTPTGAAILKASVTTFAPPRGFAVRRIGYGLGTKDFPHPNVLRVMLGTAGDAAAGPYEHERALLVESNIDDMSPEAFGPLSDALFAAGARDVFLTPITMKKGRPATKLSVLTDEDARARVLAALFAGSSTIGVRITPVDKLMLPREIRTLATRHGAVPVKIARLPDGRLRWKAEHDAVSALALGAGRPYFQLRAEIEADIAAALDREAGGGEGNG
ncbi:MAG: nickel pincer cofactor biosynthesis protein LarC [Alphaproteobacteria bacterium]|nr:nickel pincer cofactor biosynthesis protein LarC [Alphaproteobacteria bacterium]